MANPWDKDAIVSGNNVIASSPGIPKAPTGYRPGSTLAIDPGYMSGEVGLSGAKASAAAAAAAAKEMQVARYRAGLDMANYKQKTAADIAKAKTIKNLGAGAPPEKIAALNALSRQLQQTQGLYNRDFKGGNAISSLIEFLPTPSAQRFNSAAAGLSDQALAAFRTPGVGSQSDAELRAFVMANQPKNTDYDPAIEQKFQNIRNRLVERRRAYGLPDEAPPLSAKPKGKSAPKVIDFNDLPE